MAPRSGPSSPLATRRSPIPGRMGSRLGVLERDQAGPASASKWWLEHDGVQTSRRPGEDAEAACPEPSDPEPREPVPGKKQGWRAGKMERGRGTLVALLSLPGPPGEKRGPAGRAGKSGGRGPGSDSRGDAWDSWGAVRERPSGESRRGAVELAARRTGESGGSGREVGGEPDGGGRGRPERGCREGVWRAGCWGVKGGGRGPVASLLMPETVTAGMGASGRGPNPAGKSPSLSESWERCRQRLSAGARPKEGGLGRETREGKESGGKSRTAQRPGPCRAPRLDSSLRTG